MGYGQIQDIQSNGVEWCGLVKPLPVQYHVNEFGLWFSATGSICNLCLACLAGWLLLKLDSKAEFAMPDVEPIRSTVRAMAHTPPYQMHKYFARRPHNVFSHLIDYYTSKGDTVLDCFCGGGVTIYEALKLERKVIGVDLNPLATFITEMQVKNVDLTALEELFRWFLHQARTKYEGFYRLSDGRIPSWVEWVYEVQCPKCGGIIRLSQDNRVSNGMYRCTTCGFSSKRTDCAPKGRWPVRAMVPGETPTGRPDVIAFTPEEAAILSSSSNVDHITTSCLAPDEDIPVDWDRQMEDCLHAKGILKFRDLFTPRNYAINVLLFNDIQGLRGKVPEDLLDCLYFAFSASLRYTNNMSRVTDNWENGNPTSMDSHAYWLPNLFIENNVITKLDNRMAAVLKGLKHARKDMKRGPRKALSYADMAEGADYLVLTQSSDVLPLPDRSVDAIITDPPYGSNVQYAELSALWNIWYQHYRGLPGFVFDVDEAVVHRKRHSRQTKTLEHYENVLFRVFRECNRVLKDEGYLVFTFNNKNLRVWLALLRAAARAGFHLPEGGVLFQDFIEAYKNTAHLRFAGNVHGDFIYSLRKGAPTATGDQVKTLQDIRTEVEAAIDHQFATSDTCTTAQLYQAIFAALARSLMELVTSQQPGSREELPDKFLDDALASRLVYVGDRWERRGSPDGR